MTRAFASAGLALFLVASVLTNCTDKIPGLFATDEPKINPNIFPKDYKKAVVAFVTSNEPNPTKIREAAISEPVLRPLENVERYVACVRYNPSGTGVTEHIVYFIGGQINQYVKASPGQCDWAAYKPFPEVEKICLVEKCN
jgi:hypothetical protein